MTRRADDKFTRADETTCLRDALRAELEGPAIERADAEGVTAALKRWPTLSFGEKLTMIAEASHEVCLALYADVTATRPATKVI
jgi:hypothetical protein